MARPLSLLIVAIAVACVALFALIPMSKIERLDKGDPISARQAKEETTREPTDNTTVIETAAPTEAVQEDLAATQAEAHVTISGQVNDSLGAPIADLEIEFQSRGFDAEEIASSRVTSDRYGNFELQLVPNRQYRLEIPASRYFTGYSLDSFTHGNVDKLQNIVLERLEPVDVDGIIIDTDHAPVGNFELVLRHLGLEIPERVIRSDSSGYFSLRGIPAGEWRVATSQTNYFRIKGLELRPGEYRNLTLMIDRGSYYLSGWVHDTNGMPLPQVIITLKSAFARDEYHSFSYRSVATDANGGFEFANLGGHKMTLGIYAKGFKTYISEHEFASFSDTLEIELQRE